MAFRKDRSSSVSKKKTEAIEPINQKKARSISAPKEDKNLHRSSIYKSEYMKKVIKPKDKSETHFYCQVCPKEPLLLRKNVKDHITTSVTHENHVLSKDKEDHASLVQILKSKKQANIQARNKSSVEYKKTVESYLSFLAFCFQ